MDMKENWVHAKKGMGIQRYAIKINRMLTHSSDEEMVLLTNQHTLDKIYWGWNCRLDFQAGDKRAKEGRPWPAKALF